ncbi:MAG: efflux RND transporter periplasmic adaptor subunit [Gammaproteobacteria bacterium]|jgi:multidrug resistance efflux pump
MDLLLILTYTAICIAIFKIFKVPLTKWTVPTAVLGGVVLIGTLIFVMNYNHPYSEISRQYFVTTPIVPAVTGKVVEVAVRGQSRVKEGDILFKIDPTPFESKVTSLEAELSAAEPELNRQQTLLKRKLTSQSAVDLALAKVNNLKAQLETARFKLAQTVVTAPTDGYVTQVALRPGMMAASLPLRPVMIFVHDEGNYYVAWFRQNSMLRLQAGDEAEVAFDGIPGSVFSAEVKLVFPAIAEGQIQPGGNLYDPRQAASPGRLPVLIDITDPAFKQYADKVPGGAFAKTAIYTNHFHHVSIMRKVLLRMTSWMNYLFPFH